MSSDTLLRSLWANMSESAFLCMYLRSPGYVSMFACLRVCPAHLWPSVCRFFLTAVSGLFSPSVCPVSAFSCANVCAFFPPPSLSYLQTVLIAAHGLALRKTSSAYKLRYNISLTFFSKAHRIIVHTAFEFICFFVMRYHTMYEQKDGQHVFFSYERRKNVT
eukprot:GEMP01111510.1.p1 GENE.GEMP01111510.1~~GEMP01111510.1.p1  ORF type:complete len:162 (-),score=3.97 GEMP01111510.1:2-487(-)